MCFSHGGISRTKLDAEGGSCDILQADLTARLPKIALAMACCKAASLVLGFRAMAASCSGLGSELSPSPSPRSTSTWLSDNELFPRGKR